MQAAYTYGFRIVEDEFIPETHTPTIFEAPISLYDLTGKMLPAFDKIRKPVVTTDNGMQLKSSIEI